MVAPMAMPRAIIASDHDWGSPIHHRRLSHDQGRRIDDRWRWGHDYGRRCHDHGSWIDWYPNPNRNTNPGVCRERQRKTRHTKKEQQTEPPQERASLLHAISLYVEITCSLLER